MRNGNLLIAKVTCAGPFFWTFVAAHRGMYQFVGVEGHHLDQMRTTDVLRKASKLDLQCFCTPACCTWRGGTAGCAAVLCDESQIVTALDAFPRQASVLPVELPCEALAPVGFRFGPVAAALIGVYFTDVEELGSRNATKGAGLAVLVRQISIPWYTAGDCNLSPGVSAGSAWTRNAGRVVETPPCAAHNSTAGKWNMFASAVKRPDLAPMVHGIDTALDGPWKPHAEEHLIVRAPAEYIPVRRLKASFLSEQPALPKDERSSCIAPRPHYTWQACFREAAEAMLTAGKSSALSSLSYLANAAEAARMAQRQGVLVGVNEQYLTGQFGEEAGTSDEWLRCTPSNRQCSSIQWHLRASQALLQAEGWLTPQPYLWTHHDGRRWSSPNMCIVLPAPLQRWLWHVRHTQWRRASHQWLAEGSEKGACEESAKRVKRALQRSDKPREAQLALRVARGGMWIEARSKAARQSREDRCQRCGGPDNHLHRVWVGCPDVLAARMPEVESTRNLEATAMEQLHRHPYLWPKDTTPQHLMPDIPESPAHVALRATDFFDGTGLTAGGAFHCTGLIFYVNECEGDQVRRVAVVRGAGRGAGDPPRLFRGIAATLPGELQTPARACLSMVLLVFKFTSGDLVLRPDCKHVVDGLTWQDRPRRPQGVHGGLWRAIGRLLDDWLGQLLVSTARAHSNDAELRSAEGSDNADLAGYHHATRVAAAADDQNRLPHGVARPMAMVLRISAPTRSSKMIWMGRTSLQSRRHRRRMKFSRIHTGEHFHPFPPWNEVVSVDRSGSLRAATFLSVPVTIRSFGVFQISWGQKFLDAGLLHAPTLEWPWYGGRHRGWICVCCGVASHPGTQIHAHSLCCACSFFTPWMQEEAPVRGGTTHSTWVPCGGFSELT